jgi:DNA polymerase-3 subunit delta'
VGKHLAAREFVSGWLCLEGAGGACGVCDSCSRVGAGTHHDLIEVTLAEKKKTIGVEQVRDLGEWLSQSPILGRHKAAIVDPASAMTVEAANALLKILEEPPAGRVIILVVTRPGALPPTVRSRCQQVSFGALAVGEVAEVLRRNGWPAQAARQAAALAEGSPGAALALDGRLGQESAAAVRSLFDALASGQRGAALAFAEAAGEPRERALASLQAIVGFTRLAARRHLGDCAGETVALPAPLARLAPEQTSRLLAQALETLRRLEGDRPLNAKLALANLLAGAADALAGQ